jgi:hypothetical protein
MVMRVERRMQAVIATYNVTSASPCLVAIVLLSFRMIVNCCC